MLAAGAVQMNGLGSALWCSRYFDGGFELGDAAEGAAPDGILGDQPEEALHEVEPGGGGGGEVQLEARMLGEPRLHPWMLVGGIVVDDGMQIEPFRRGAVDVA